MFILHSDGGKPKAGQRYNRRRREDRQKKVLEAGGWPCRLLLAASTRQESGLLSRAELLITWEEQERWCLFVFESSSFCLFLTQLGHPQIERAENKAPGRTLLEVSPAQRWSPPWNSIVLSLRTRFPGWHSDSGNLDADLAGGTQVQNSLCTELLMSCL